MIKWMKLSTIVLSIAVATGTASAQNSNDKTSKDKSDKSQEIVIRKNGDKGEKMTIVVDGDKVTINGKPIDEFKNGDVSVFRRDRSTNESPRARAITIPRGSYRSFNDGELFGARGNKAMLGVMTGKADNGAKITEVTKESGADKAGLKKDDVITKVGSKKVEGPEDLIEAIGTYKPNDKVDITYNRNGKESRTTATLGENKAARAYSYNFNSPDFNFDVPRTPVPPNMDGFSFNFNRKPKIGLQIQDVEEGKGVKVKDVDDESPASKSGIKEGDVITEVNGKEVAGVDELRSQIKDIKEGDTVKFRYKRGGKTDTAEIKIPKKLKTADL